MQFPSERPFVNDYYETQKTVLKIVGKTAISLDKIENLLKRYTLYLKLYDYLIEISYVDCNIALTYFQKTSRIQKGTFNDVHIKY